MNINFDYDPFFRQEMSFKYEGVLKYNLNHIFIY